MSSHEHYVRSVRDKSDPKNFQVRLKSAAVGQYDNLMQAVVTETGWIGILDRLLGLGTSCGPRGRGAPLRAVQSASQHALKVTVMMTN